MIGGAARDRPTAVLIHGLGRTSRSMRPVAAALERREHRVVNLDYPSRSAGIRALAALVARQIHALDADTPLNFVTHSLGGVLLRVAVADGHLPLERVGRVVMLGPPNGGSQIADALTSQRALGVVFRLAIGPAGAELGVADDGIVATLPPLPFETGIIAGSRSVNPVLSQLLPTPNDGKVSVTEAAAAGMRGFIVVPHSHPFLMRSKIVLTRTVEFLETGKFA